MANLKTQFSDLRKSTPKYVQWLLLAAAVIIVLILVTVMFRGNNKATEKTPPVGFIQPELIINPDALDWAKIDVGEVINQRFVISASAPVVIDKVSLSEEVADLSQPRTTCTNMGQINDKISCTISMEYAPKKASQTKNISLSIVWRGVNQPENMARTDKISIAIGAVAAPVEQAKPTPVEQPKPEPVFVAPEPAPVVESKPTIRQEIETIAQADPFALDPAPKPVAKPEPANVQTQSQEIDETVPSEACSDFAFPGYGTSGQQIGWIRPHGGSYNFHPFSDRNCDSPTGIYNPDNGLITDKTGKKIGTDAEHIGYNPISNGTLPQLSNPVATKPVNRARQLSADELTTEQYAGSKRVFQKPEPQSSLLPSSMGSEATVSSRPYDRTFVLRQYKPIPATIVSEIRAVAGETKLPVTATIDRNVYSDNGRTIILPAGTMMLGFVSDRDMPGPYKTIGRVGIEWYRFVRPDGVEFNFTTNNKPFSGDAQGRTGVPGRGSTDYVEQFVMPMLTAIVPAAVNMIAPISDKFINQIDLDNNVVTQTGQVRSSELAKNEIITAWNKVAQKLLVDMMDNSVPPFSIASGTRITVFSPNDLIVTCGTDTGMKCSITAYDNSYAPTGNMDRVVTVGVNDKSSLIGQVRSFSLDEYCDGKGGVIANSEYKIQQEGLDYRTVVFYCQTNQYEAINNAKQQAVYQNQQQTSNTSNGTKLTPGSQGYNEQVLGLNYNDDGTIQNPFQKLPVETPPAAITCEDGTPPDVNGCCTGETFTDMGEQGFNCCPASGGDCFPPII